MVTVPIALVGVSSASPPLATLLASTQAAYAAGLGLSPAMVGVNQTDTTLSATLALVASSATPAAVLSAQIQEALAVAAGVQPRLVVVFVSTSAAAAALPPPASGRRMQLLAPPQPTTVPVNASFSIGSLGIGAPGLTFALGVSVTLTSTLASVAANSSLGALLSADGLSNMTLTSPARVAVLLNVLISTPYFSAAGTQAAVAAALCTNRTAMYRALGANSLNGNCLQPLAVGSSAAAGATSSSDTTAVASAQAGTTLCGGSESHARSVVAAASSCSATGGISAPAVAPFTGTIPPPSPPSSPAGRPRGRTSA